MRRYKGVDHVRYRIRAPRFPREILSGLRTDFMLKDAFGVTALTKTDTEIGAFNEVVGALNELRSDLGLPSVMHTADLWHVLTDQEFEAKIPDKAFALAHHGNVYTRRRPDVGIVMHTLAHEVVHSSSYWALMAQIHYEKTKDGDKTDVRYKAWRSGMCVCVGGSRPSTSFKGLDEGVTELAAHLIRRKLALKSAILNDEQREMLTKSWTCYRPTVRLLEAAFGDVRLTDDDYPGPRLRGLIADHQTGSTLTLRELGRRSRIAVKALRDMDVTAESALAVAQVMRLDEAAADLEKFIANRSTSSAPA